MTEYFALNASERRHFECAVVSTCFTQEDYLWHTASNLLFPNYSEASSNDWVALYNMLNLFHFLKIAAYVTNQNLD